MSQIKHDLTRTVLAVVCIAGLTAASFWVLRPFLGATIWAAMLVVATGRALAYGLHPLRLLWSRLPLGLMAAAVFGLGWFWWEPSVAGVRRQWRS